MGFARVHAWVYAGVPMHCYSHSTTVPDMSDAVMAVHAAVSIMLHNGAPRRRIRIARVDLLDPDVQPFKT